MEAVVFEFLAKNYPWLFCVLIAIVISVIVTVHIMRRLNDIKNVKQELESLQLTADCKVHHAAISNTKDDVKSIRDDLKSVLSGISNLKAAIISIKPATASMFAKANSPLQLNDKGRALFTASKADAILNDNTEQWVEQLHSMGLKTALDIEDQSRILLLGLVNEDVFIPLKNYVYNHPILEDTPVTIDDICFIMGLELRNLYLERYPDILPEG